MQKVSEYLTEKGFGNDQWIGMKKYGEIHVATVKNLDLIILGKDPEVITTEAVYVKGLGIIPVLITYG